MNRKVQIDNVQKEANGAPFTLKNFMTFKNDEVIVPNPTAHPVPYFVNRNGHILAASDSFFSEHLNPLPHFAKQPLLKRYYTSQNQRSLS